MRLNLEQKETLVAEVKGYLADAQFVLLAEYRGMTVAEVSELRRKAREMGTVCKVIKNTLLHRAVEETPFSVLQEKLVGPLIFSCSSDPAALAKMSLKFADAHEHYVLKAGALPGSLVEEKDLKAVSEMPSREELLGMLVGTMQAPISKFVQTLNEVPSRFVRTVNEVPAGFVRTVAAVRDQKDQQAA